MMPNHQLTSLWHSTKSAPRLVTQFHSLLVQQDLGSIGRCSASVLEAGQHKSKLKKVLIEHNIEPDCLWSMDETGLQFNHTPKKQVIGPAGKHQQHSIRSGTRDFATIIPLISAAGACPALTVIFQGVRLNTSWTGLGNPLNAL